jgi:AcrR family transcriptional regulator
MTPVSTPDPAPGRREQLVDVLFRIVAEHGLEAATVREVAAAAGVSIGAVQHHFPSKDEMLAAAFRRVVARTRQRVAALPRTGAARDDLVAVLAELLPLDVPRRTEARVHLAFAARAATSAALQEIQRPLLREIRAELAERIGDGGAVHAALLLAVVDGLALHEISAPEGLRTDVIEAALRAAVDAALGLRDRTTGDGR